MLVRGNVPANYSVTEVNIVCLGVIHTREPPPLVFGAHVTRYIFFCEQGAGSFISPWVQVLPSCRWKRGISAGCVSRNRQVNAFPVFLWSWVSWLFIHLSVPVNFAAYCSEESVLLPAVDNWWVIAWIFLFVSCRWSCEVRWDGIQMYHRYVRSCGRSARFICEWTRPSFYAAVQKEVQKEDITCCQGFWDGFAPLFVGTYLQVKHI